MKSLTVFTALSLIIFCGCESKEDRIKRNWKYIEGFHFGDFLCFEDQRVQIKNDTLYINLESFAVIEDLIIDYVPGTENKLLLKDIGTGEIGMYTDKGKNTND